jgi:hypothetical protein
MKFRWVVALLSAALMTSAAHAQIGVYFNPIVTRVSNSTADTGPFAFLGDGKTSQIFGGLSMGGYYDVPSKTPSPLRFGVDIRDEIEHGNNAMLNSFLVGLRVSGRLHSGWQPYAQVSVGAGTTRSPYSAVHTTDVVFKGYGGLDYHVKKHLDVRAIEIGYGPLTTVSSSKIGGSTPTIPAAKLLSFSGGLVFRFK